MSLLLKIQNFLLKVGLHSTTSHTILKRFSNIW